MELFHGCTSLVYVPLFDTSNLTKMNHTFTDCSSLSAIPLFDTSNITQLHNTFYNCVNVQTGALDLYRHSLNVPIHYKVFTNCGINTETGSAELAQIPSDWK